MADHQCRLLRRCSWRGLAEFHGVLLRGVVAHGIVAKGVVAHDAVACGVMVHGIGITAFLTRILVCRVSLKFFTVS